MEITKIGLLTVKAEATYGTDPVPTMAANSIPTVGDSLSWTVNSTAVARKLQDGTLDRVPGFNAMPNITLKFKYELRGNYNGGGNLLDISNGTSAQALEIDALLQAANLKPTYTPAATPGVQGSSAGTRDGYVTYQPGIFSTQGPSVTCYWYTVLKLHKLVGGKVNIDKINYTAGQIASIDFSVQGKYVAPVDNALDTSTAVFKATKPPLFDGAAIALGGYAPIISAVTLELGNQIKMRKSASDSDSIAGFVISDFVPKGTIDPEAVTEATNPFWANWKAPVTQTLVIQHGTQSGNKATATVIAEPKTVQYGARDDIRIHQMGFDIVKSDLTGAIGTQFQLKFF